ncbi:helix-turn-helix transcriptional regulator [Sphingobacterium detergens]|uniref:Regulatory LuxR family protein n=1 Tax=Sphingobacterium detergens TaxID=1145106 RepID=A0A420BK15_SPHD1|nr:hypothetical protein [Sphingobacterium detergens]RKE57062.1 hypothetical protein DFQ12_1938 [Sphingobacterium detergens]
MVKNPTNYYLRVLVIDVPNQSNLISKSMYVNSSFETVDEMLSSYQKTSALIYKGSFSNYAIVVKSILYPFEKKYLKPDYFDLMRMELSYWKSSSRPYLKEMFSHATFLHRVPQFDRADAQAENKQQDKTIATIESNYTQPTEHVVFLSGFCFLLIISVFVLRHWYKMKEKDHDKLQLEKNDFERRINLEIQLKVEENLKLRYLNEDLERRINQQFQMQKEELLKLQSEYETMQKEALVEALRMERKNKLLDLLREKLKSFEDLENVGVLERMIKDEMRLDETVGQSAREFQDINPDFFLRLKEISKNKLSALELRYCAYMYLNLTTKEISAAFHIEPSSVRVTKYRIKQKLQLSREDDLESFVQKLV